MRRGSRPLLLLCLLIRFAASSSHHAIDSVDAARHFCLSMSSWSNFLVTIFFFQSFFVKPLVISRGRGRLCLVVSLSLCSLVLFVLVCLSVMYLYWILLISCLIMLPSVSLSCSWGVPRCCFGSLQSWGFLHRLPWSTLLTPSFSAQALREWRRADGFCTFRPLVRVRVCATHSVRCLVLKLCVCIWTCQFVLSCRGSLRCLFLWA